MLNDTAGAPSERYDTFETLTTVLISIYLHVEFYRCRRARCEIGYREAALRIISGIGSAVDLYASRNVCRAVGHSVFEQHIEEFGLGVVGYGDGMHSGFAFPYKEFVAALYFEYGIGKDLVLTVLLVALPGSI